MTWIHDKANFSEENVRERARKYGFSDPLPVEFFLWDCEIAAQLQMESENLVLKGGAAAQLHLSVEMQRGSIDVDIVAPEKKDHVAEILSQIHKRIPTVDFEKYTPKRPHKEISMVTYLAKMQPLIPSKNGRPREVKIDFLLEDLELPTQVVRNKETFALNIKQMKCYSAASLIGDKILTLAENTIGIKDLPDVPKQIYDVSVLLDSQTLSKSQISEICDAIGKIAPLEAKYRGLDATIEEILNDIEQTMDKYALSDTPGADPNIKRNIGNFQQFYVSASQKWPLYDWCSRILKIRFLCRLMIAVFKGKETIEDTFETYSSAVQVDRMLSIVSSERVKLINNILRELAETKIPYFRELKGKPLKRVFWQVVSENNLAKIIEAAK